MKSMIYISCIAIIIGVFFLVERDSDSNEDCNASQDHHFCCWSIEGFFVNMKNCDRIPFTSYGYGENIEIAKQDAENQLKESQAAFGFSGYGIDSKIGKEFENKNAGIQPRFFAGGSCSEEISFNF